MTQSFNVLRLFFDGGEADRARAGALQAGFEAAPLSLWPERATWRAPAADVFEPSDRAADPLADFRAVQRMMAETAPPAADAGLLAEFRAIGVGPGLDAGFAGLDERARRGLELAEAEGRRRVVADTRAMVGGRTINGWRYPAADIGRYGDNHAYRAAVTQMGTVALPASEGIYLIAQADAAGRKLSGAHRYTLRFEKGGLPPAEAFWSIHLYRYEGFTVVPNPIGRYSIGDRTRGLKLAADGSLTLYLQADDPGPDRRANWLPSLAGEDFFLVLRGYEPYGGLAEMTWTGPSVARG